jgi:hypothetical protein
LNILAKKKRQVKLKMKQWNFNRDERLPDVVAHCTFLSIAQGIILQSPIVTRLSTLAIKVPTGRRHIIRYTSHLPRLLNSQTFEQPRKRLTEMILPWRFTFEWHS